MLEPMTRPNDRAVTAAILVLAAAAISVIIAAVAASW
jgi:hypothetical protein